ncbi:TPA: hypothetical protein U2I51_004227 [Providencia rettgeri]|nr:hypothetical protein [Providencia rettgeri]
MSQFSVTPLKRSVTRSVEFCLSENERVVVSVKSSLGNAQPAYFTLYWIGRERSELNNTKFTATELFNGRRQKKCSAIRPSNARELLKCFKVCFEKEQTMFATSF